MRTHCFISTTAAGGRGTTRWAWHTADDNGVSRKHSETAFADFNACVGDARAHGYHHVEVPLLHWSPTGEVCVAAAPRVEPPAAIAPDGLQ